MHSAKSILSHPIVAQDGAFGYISDLYFDDERWTLRYLVLDTGHSMPQREVLIPPASIAYEESAVNSIQVRLTRAQVEKCPDQLTDKPVYLQYGLSGFAPAGDPHLRSTEVVIGFRVRAVDGTVGRLKDIVLDTHTWDIAYLVVEPEGWLVSKRVLVPPELVDRIHRPERRISLRLSKDDFRSLPQA